MVQLKNYVASKEDLETIEEGIKYAWSPRLDYIFTDKSQIKDIAVISYDSKYIYLWLKGKFSKIPHQLKIQKKLQQGWAACLLEENIKKYLPKEIYDNNLPIISGGLLGPFIKLQKQKKSLNNPYTTKGSYLATIVHEFGHVYYNQHNLDKYPNKEEGLELFRSSLDLYLQGTTSGGKIPVLCLPHPLNFSEIFAFCTEYSASKIFFKNHKRMVDKFDISWIKNLLKKKETIDFSDSKVTHATAAVVGKIITSTYPRIWPQKLLTKHYV